MVVSARSGASATISTEIFTDFDRSMTSRRARWRDDARYEKAATWAALIAVVEPAEYDMSVDKRHFGLSVERFVSSTEQTRATPLSILRQARILWEALPMSRMITKAWTPEDLVHLEELVASGATLLRASAALGRRSTAVQKKASELGKPLSGVRIVRARMRKATADSVSNPGFRGARFTVTE